MAPGSLNKDQCVLPSSDEVDKLFFISTTYYQAEKFNCELCLVAEPDKVLVGELNEWVANPLGPGQTSALQIKTRSA